MDRRFGEEVDNPVAKYVVVRRISRVIDAQQMGICVLVAPRAECGYGAREFHLHTLPRPLCRRHQARSSRSLSFCFAGIPAQPSHMGAECMPVRQPEWLTGLLCECDTLLDRRASLAQVGRG